MRPELRVSKSVFVSPDRVVLLLERGPMSTTTKQTVVPLCHDHCPECGVSDKEIGHLAVTDAVYCEVCLETSSTSGSSDGRRPRTRPTRHNTSTLHARLRAGAWGGGVGFSARAVFDAGFFAGGLVWAGAFVFAADMILGFVVAPWPRLFFSAAMRSMTLPRSGSSSASGAIPSPCSLASITARSRAS